MLIKYLAGPIVGAIIGCFTNYIAVKMLFRPRTEKHIFGMRIPLTPGAIPKGKARLAKAAGEVVSTHLVTESDISTRFLADDTVKMVVDKAMSVFDRKIGDDISRVAPDEAAYEKWNARINDVVTKEIVKTLEEFDVDDLLKHTVKRKIAAKLSGHMLGFIITEQTVDSMLASVSLEIKKYIKEKGYVKILPIVSSKTEMLRDSSVIQLSEQSGMLEEDLRKIVSDAYRSAVSRGVPALVKEVNIAAIIEKKINDMPAAELERLVLSVMNKELNMIVFLGALIGAVIGVINIFI